MKKTLLKILILCMVICFALCVFTACDDTSSGSGDSSYNNTYYLYKNSKYDETNYIKLDSGKFERLQTTAGVAMPKIFGTYTVTDGTIKFYATEDGETANVYNGTIKEGVLTLEKSTFNPTVQTFCAKGYTPSGKIDSGNNQDSDGDNTQQTLYYTVTFNSNGGSNILSQSIVENGYATKPTNPTKSGYTFVGWYSNSALTTSWNFNTNKVTVNITLYAKWQEEIKYYTVTVNRNDNSYGTVSPSSIANVPYGSAITVYGNKLTVNGTTVTATPTTDTAQYSYAFSNWTYSTTVTGATTVTANFTRTVNNYNVNINVINPEYGQITATTLNGINYGTNISHNGNVLTVGGNTVTATPNSDTDNYSYSVNWSHDLTTSENTNITVTFTRTVNQYAVTFYNDDGTTVLGTSTVDYGTAATYPNSAPTKDTTAQYSYAFDKWVTEQDGEVEDNLTNVVVNRNVYAKYTAMPRVYNVYYNENGGTAIADTTYTYGVGLILPTKTDISFTGYSFLGWYDSNNNLVTEILASSTGDITLNANWTPFALQNITYNTE